MRRVRTETNIGAESASVAEDYNLFRIVSCSQQLELFYSTISKILPKNLSFKVYKIQLLQAPEPSDLTRRVFLLNGL